jgi:hypothetical protein
MRKSYAGVAGLLLLSACVTHPSNITTSFVGHAQYRGMACAEIERELVRVSTQEADKSRIQGANFAADTAMLTVGLLVFWPALLAMPLTTDHRHEISRMRGEKEALERARDGQCSGAVTTQAVPTIPDSLSMSAAVAAGGVVAAPAPVVAVAPAPVSRQPWPLGCPATGTVVFYSNNSTLTSEGRDRDDPRLCRVLLGANQQRLIYGLVNDNSYGSDNYRLGLGALHEPAGIIPTGRVSDFVAFRTMPNGLSQQFRERWSVGGEETIHTAAGEFRTVVVEQLLESQGGGHQSTSRYWLDITTGVIVRKTVSLRAGTTQDNGYEAIRITTRAS